MVIERPSTCSIRTAQVTFGCPSISARQAPHSRCGAQPDLSDLSLKRLAQDVEQRLVGPGLDLARFAVELEFDRPHIPPVPSAHYASITKDRRTARVIIALRRSSRRGHEMRQNLRINGARLWSRLQRLAEEGARPDGGVCRLALSDADKAGRDLVVQWMRELGLTVTIDAIGNVVGVRRGEEDGAPVMIGSHIDTVATGGRYDGALGVLGRARGDRRRSTTPASSPSGRSRSPSSPTRRARASSPTCSAAWSSPARCRSSARWPRSASTARSPARS